MVIMRNPSTTECLPLGIEEGRDVIVYVKSEKCIALVRIKLEVLETH
jgi:hypothetical protein